MLTKDMILFVIVVLVVLAFTTTLYYYNSYQVGAISVSAKWEFSSNNQFACNSQLEKKDHLYMNESLFGVNVMQENGVYFIKFVC